MLLNLDIEQFVNITPTFQVLTIASILIAIVYYYGFIASTDLPPGPVGIPVLGYWPFLTNENFGQRMKDLQKKYGNVFSVNFCRRRFISLGSHKAIKEAYISKSDCFAMKSTSFNFLREILKGGIPFSNGDLWKTQRKFFLSLLREYGFSTMKDTMARSLHESIQDTNNEINNFNRKPFHLFELLIGKCNKIIRDTLFRDFVTEEQVKEIVELYVVEASAMTPKNLVLTGFIGRLLISSMSLFQKAMSSHKKVKRILFDIIEDHKKTYNEYCMRDIIDEYIREKKKRLEKGDPTEKYFTEETNLCGYKIPKGSITFMNFISINNNIETYEEPESFNPSRFMSREGSLRAELPILFGLGKRACLGEGFAMTQAFMFLTSFVKKFHLSPGNEELKQISIAKAVLSVNTWVCAMPRTK